MLRKRNTYRTGQARRILASAAMACILAVTAVMPSSAATARATTMKLEKTEGTATLKTQNGSARKITTGMRLYSGNTLATETASYAYVSLDSSKAVKLDEKTTTTLRQSGKDLELLVKSGKLFFNVSSPLTEKEDMNIRTSSMVTGIRGTCGVVEYVNPNKSKLYLIEGQVTLGYDENATTIHGGQTATVILQKKDEAGASGGSGDNGNTAKDMEQKVYVDKLTEASVPIFAITEILSDPVLQQKIEKTTDLEIKKFEEVLKQSQQEPGEEEQKQEETTSSGGSTGNVVIEPEPIILKGSSVTEADVYTAWNTCNEVTLSSDGVDDNVLVIEELAIPANKTLVVDTQVGVAEAVEVEQEPGQEPENILGKITVATGGELVISENGSLSNVGELINNGTLTNEGTLNNSVELTNNGTLTNSGNGTLTNNGTLYNTGTINNSGSIINYGTITDTGNGVILESGSTLTNSGTMTGSGDAVISLKGGTLILGEADGSSEGCISNTGVGYAIAVAENPKSTIQWNDETIKIYSSSDLDHAIQGLTEVESEMESEMESVIVVPTNLALSPSTGFIWSEENKMLYFER